MDRSKIVEKISNSRLFKLKQFIIKLNSLTHSNRLSYLNNIKSDKINLNSEIVLNFLNNKIKTDIKLYTFLKRLKESLHILAKKSKSYISKRQLLSSLKDLQILKLILSLVSITLNIIK